MSKPATPSFPMTRLFKAYFYFLFLPGLCLSAKTDLVDLVGANPWVVLEMDLPGLKEGFNAGPFKEGLEGFLEKAQNAFWEGLEDAEDPSKEDLEEFLGFVQGIGGKFNGQAVGAFGVGLDDIASLGKDAGWDANLLFLAETEGDFSDLREFAKWMERLGEDAPVFSEEEVEGTPVLFLEGSYLEDELVAPFEGWKNFDKIISLDDGDIGEEEEEDDKAEGGPADPGRRIGFLIHKGVFAMCVGQQKVTSLLQDIEEGSSPDSAKGDFEESFNEIGKGDANLYLNTSFLREFVRFMKDSEKMKIPENPTKVTTKGIMEAVALEELEGFALNWDFTKEGAEIGSAMYVGENKGIWKFLDLYLSGHQLPGFVPKGVFYASSAGFELGEVWPVVEGIIMEASPVLKGMLDFQMQVLDKTHKSNLRKDLLTNIGNRITTYSHFPEVSFEDEMDMVAAREVYVLGLKDGTTFSRSWNQLLGSILGEKLKSRTHKGVDVKFIHTVGETYLSYAVTQQNFVASMGKPSDINQVLGHLLDPPAESLWSSPEVNAVIQDAPQDVAQWDYFDFEGFPNFMNEMIQEMFEDELPWGILEYGLPTLPYFMTTWTKRTKDGLLSKTTILPKE